MWNNNGDCGCLWIILIIILLVCCCGNGSTGGCCHGEHHGCGCVCGSERC